MTTETERDLASSDVWAESLQRSLARRGEPRRSSTALSTLRGPRDLTDEEAIQDSLGYSRRRRHAAENQIGVVPGLARRPISLAGLLAVVGGPAVGVAAVKGIGSSGAGDWRTASAPASEPTVKPHAVEAGSGGALAKPAASSSSSSQLASFNTPAKAATKRFSHRPRVMEGSVRQVQRALGVPVDGVFGSGTIKALRNFQSSHGLKRDAIVGPATWAALKNQLHAPRAQRSSQTRTGHVRVTRASVGHRRGGGVSAMQRALGLSADGVFGPATTRAIKRFQKRHGLTPDGVVGGNTRHALGIGDGATLHPRHLKRTARHRSTTGTGGGGGGNAGGGGAISAMVAAANRIAGLPYIYGGGHGSFDAAGYDCSGSVSYVLHAGGLLSSPLDSSALMSYGAPGPGKYVTIYSNPGHAYMTINGRRFDTSGVRQGGSRWASGPRSSGGFVVRHPPGL